MKVFKKVLAAGVALMMAVTGMTMGASAVYWDVYYGSSYKPTDDQAFSPLSSTSSFYDTCTSFTQYDNAYGVQAYVKYYAYYIDSYGGEHSCSSQYEYHHTKTNSYPPISMTRSFANYATFHVKHTLQMNGNTASMGGNVYI